MTSKQYFDALCREEAGEFVFKTATGVEVVFESRPRDQAREAQFLHLFSMEDPYGYVNGETQREIGVTWTAGDVYRAIERAVPGTSNVERVFRRSRSEWKQTGEVLDQPSEARYAFVWRGIVRPQDRENGIAGGELIAFDLMTKEILGFRRGFAVTGVGARGVSWEFAAVCPTMNLRNGRNKDFDFSLWFVSRVLQPPGYEKYREEISTKQ